jgi:nucleoside-diphosphate-sugar epimerase
MPHATRFTVLAVLFALAMPAQAQDAIKPGGVLIFGGSGQAGSKIAKLLADKGETVTVFVRPTSNRKNLAGVKVQYIEGDATVAADVESAMLKAKPRAAINALGRPRDQWGFWAVTQINMTSAAKKAGTKELIYLSSVGVGDSVGAYSPEARERTKVVHAERLIAEENIKASGLDYVIIRIGGVSFFNEPPSGKASLTEDRTVLGMIRYADLAQLTVDCIGNATCKNKTWASVDPTVKRPERP